MRACLRFAATCWVAALVCGASLSGSSGLARADKLDLQQFHPAATSTGYLSLDDPSVLPAWRAAVGLYLSDGHDALVLRDGNQIVPSGHIVQHQVWLEAMGSIGFFNRFEVGLALPVALYQGGDAAPSGYDVAAALRGQRGAGLGDLRLDGKILLFDRSIHRHHHLALALVIGLTAPTSTQDLAGEHNATSRPRLVFEWAFHRLHLVSTFGAVLRARAEVLGIDVTHQLTFGLGARVRIWSGLEAYGEIRGAVDVALPRGVALKSVDAPGEFEVGLGWQTKVGLRPFLAGGAGLGRGYGDPTFRVLVGARYAIPAMKKEAPWVDEDADHDGVPNGLDRCLTEAGPAANGGCPDGDLDGDQVVDRLDACPERSGPAANNGCPDYDTDGDNIPDRLDKCPKQQGSRQNLGCPARDSDGDGVPDVIDRCRDKPGSAENDGCPDIDSDGDGLVDRLDKCPFDAEVYNGEKDDDGCPETAPALADLAAGQVALFEPIVFDKDGAGEKLSAKSTRVLLAAAALLRNHVEIARVRIEGHTDDRGSPVDNLDLSLARAQLVRHFLVEEGKVAPERVMAQGFGGDRPLVDNATPQGRARNRRIEITVLESK
ncbi:MAG: OmpA family protein [Polyangia bacterium]